MLQYCVQNQSPGGEVVNAAVCKTATRGFESHPGLTNFINLLRLIKFVSPGEVCMRTLRVGFERRKQVARSIASTTAEPGS